MNITFTLQNERIKYIHSSHKYVWIHTSQALSEAVEMQQGAKEQKCKTSQSYILASGDKKAKTKRIETCVT